MGADESKLGTAGTGDMVSRLLEVMEREIEGAKPDRADTGPDSIARLQLDSLALIGYLVAVEDEFGVEWDPDVDADVLRSFDAMARYLLAKGVEVT